MQIYIEKKQKRNHRWRKVLFDFPFHVTYNKKMMISLEMQSIGNRMQVFKIALRCNHG